MSIGRLDMTFILTPRSLSRTKKADLAARLFLPPSKERSLLRSAGSLCRCWRAERIGPAPIGQHLVAHRHGEERWVGFCTDDVLERVGLLAVSRVGALAHDDHAELLR